MPVALKQTRQTRITHVIVTSRKREETPSDSQSRSITFYVSSGRFSKKKFLKQIGGDTEEVIEVRRVPNAFKRELERNKPALIVKGEKIGAVGGISYGFAENNEGGYDAISLAYGPKHELDPEKDRRFTLEYAAEMLRNGKTDKGIIECPGLGYYLEIIALEHLKTLKLGKPITHARTTEKPSDSRRAQLEKTGIREKTVVYDKEKREARCYREPVNEWIAALKKRLYEKRGPILEPWWRKPAYYVRSYAARIKRKRAA